MQKSNLLKSGGCEMIPLMMEDNAWIQWGRQNGQLQE